MKVLVTGASGFVGQWLCQKLLDLGLEVQVLVRDQNWAQAPSLNAASVFLGDVTKPESLRSAVKDCSAVFHLAGLIGYSRAARPAMDRVNIDGTRNILEACVEARVTRLVHMSSVVAVGASRRPTPLNEDSPYDLADLNLGYFETKRQAEMLVRDFVARGKIDAVMCNPSTIYGAGDALKGSRKTQVKVAKGEFPFYTSGGVSVVAVEDVVEAMIQAWKIGRTGERYILSGENLTIQQLFQMIASCAGVRPPRFHMPTPLVFALGHLGDALEKIGRKGLINTENAWTSTLYHWFDHQKAQRELGFNPRPAEIAIRNSVNWMKENGLLNSGS